MTGRPNKYFSHVQPYLDVIKAWCRNGATDLFIADRLGVGISNFMRYKKDFRELREALQTNKEIADLQVENALHKLATGYDVEEVKESTATEGTSTVDGKKKRSNAAQKKLVTVTKKHIKPDFRAACKWLGSRQPERWAKDARNSEDKGDEQLTALYEAMTPEEREKALAELEAEGNA